MMLKIAYVYPDLLNLYGDGGNLRCLCWRSRMRGVAVQVDEFPCGLPLPTDYDIYFIGGGQDFEQSVLLGDLKNMGKDAALCQIVEQGGGAHRAHMHGPARRRGASRQLRGNMRHQQGMRPHIVEHFVLVPEGEAGFVIRNDGSARLRRKRGMPGKRRFGKGIQRMPATDVFRRNGMGCQYGAHSGTMPPSPAQGKAGNCNLPVHAPR